MSWINDLDACASAGIISFDAPAYVRGAQPRYVGNPDFAQIPDYLPPVKQKPIKDEFTKSDDPHHNPAWKKALFGTLVIGGLAAGIYTISKGKINLKNIKMPDFIKNIKKPEFLEKIKVPDWVKDNKVVNFIKDIPTKFKNSKLGEKIKNLFQKP